jgi:hypothetical protein
LSAHLRLGLPSGLFPSGFPTNILYVFLFPVPWDSRLYFTVSGSRLPFSSLPTTQRVTVEVFDPSPHFSRLISKGWYFRPNIHLTRSLEFALCLFLEVIQPRNSPLREMT